MCSDCLSLSAAAPANEKSTGLAQIVQVGPIFWLVIPIRGLKLAQNVGWSVKVCSTIASVWRALSREAAADDMEQAFLYGDSI